MHISIDDCVTDSLARLEPKSFEEGHTNISVSEHECEIYVWPQEWDDSSCGFGGMSCGMITKSPTVVVIGPMEDVMVYHAGEFAYKTEVSDKFWNCVKNNNLPGSC